MTAAEKVDAAYREYKAATTEEDEAVWLELWNEALDGEEVDGNFTYTGPFSAPQEVLDAMKKVA